MYKKAIYEYDDNKLVNSGKCAVYDDDGNFLRNETLEGEVYIGTFRTPQVSDKDKEFAEQREKIRKDLFWMFS